MAETPIVYVICDKNCRFEGMTKEQILTAIMQAVENGTISNIDAGFITTIKTINGVPLKFFIGEQAAYDELTAEEKKNLFAIITNDTTKEGFIRAIEDLQTRTETLENWKNAVMDGKITVDKAQKIKVSADRLKYLHNLFGLSAFESNKTYSKMCTADQIKEYFPILKTCLVDLYFGDESRQHCATVLMRCSYILGGLGNVTYILHIGVGGLAFPINIRDDGYISFITPSVEGGELQIAITPIIE